MALALDDLKQSINNLKNQFNEMPADFHKHIKARLLSRYNIYIDLLKTLKLHQTGINKLQQIIDDQTVKDTQIQHHKVYQEFKETNDKELQTELELITNKYNSSKYIIFVNPSNVYPATESNTEITQSIAQSLEKTLNDTNFKYLNDVAIKFLESECMVEKKSIQDKFDKQMSDFANELSAETTAVIEQCMKSAKFHAEKLNIYNAELETVTNEYSNLYPDPELISSTLNRTVMNNSSELEIRFPGEFIKLKEIYKKLLIDLEMYPTITNNNEKQFSHYDLHPKNILKQKKDNYAFLDFESCGVLDPNIAWGFTLIKILRQVMAGSEIILDPIIVGKKSLDLIQDQEFADTLTVPLLPVFGRVEVMRRLTYIIDEFENYNSETWLSVLPIQVQLLRESYILFP